MQRVLTIALLLAAAAPAFGQTASETDAETDADTESERESEAAEADADAASDASDADDDDWMSAADEPQDGDEDWLQAADDEEPPSFFSEVDDAEEDDSLWDRTTFSLTSTTVGQYRFDNFDTFEHNDEYLSFWERLEIAAQVDELRITARVDAFLALLEDACPDVLDPDDCVRDDLRLERFTAHWEHEGLKLDAGDSYAVFGRGLALSMRRVDILGIDNSLRGGQVAYDRHGVFVRALGGAANPQNLDPQFLTIRRIPRDRIRTGGFAPELHDWIAGGELGVRIGPDDTVEIGLHGERVWFARNDTLDEDTTVDVYGFRLSAPTILGGKFAFYGEANFLQRDRDSDLIGMRNDTGYGIYATAQASVDSFSVLLEWKDYSNYMVAETNLTGETHRVYSAAPTLELDSERPRALHNARGGRVQVDYGFQPGPWSLSGNFLMYGHAEDIEEDPFDGILVTHGYARLQKVPDEDLGEDEWGWTMELLGGARRESYLHDPFGDDVGKWDLDWRVLHVQLDLGLVRGKHSLELTFIHRDERLRNISLVHYERGTLSLTWSYAGKIRISPVLNWNTEQADNPSYYPGGEVRVDFLQGSFVRIFGGRTPGGRVCSGGVCRDVPPFEGVLAEVVLRI